MPKLSLHPSSVQFPAVLPPAGTAVPSTQAQLGACFKSAWLLAMGATWLVWRENARTKGESVCYWARESFWVKLGYSLGTDWALLQPNQSTTQVFTGLGWAHRLTNLLPRPSRVVSLIQSYPG